MRVRISLSAVVLGLMAGALAGPTAADEDPSVVIVIEDHRFIPSEVTVPTGERVELVIENHDPTPEEFESTDLRREKIVVGNGKASVWVGPLPAGTYRFFGDFNAETAQGTLIAK